MTNSFLRSLSCEWMKTRRTAAVRLALFGAILIPFIMTIAQLSFPDKMSFNANPESFWIKLYIHSWEFMAVLLLPFGIILITSMLIQIEVRNNTWKQTLITPQSLTVIFLSKLSIISFLLILFFLVFNFSIIVSGILPGVLHSKIDIPNQWPPLVKIANDMAAMWLTSLPLLGLQYTISLRFNNFIIPISIGLGCIIAGIFALQWKNGFLIPFAYSSFHFMTMSGQEKFKFPYDIYWLSLLWFILFSAIGYISFLYRKYKA
jgi:lantibiotic transport system permease protein